MNHSTSVSSSYTTCPIPPNSQTSFNPSSSRVNQISKTSFENSSPLEQSKKIIQNSKPLSQKNQSNPYLDKLNTFLDLLKQKHPNLIINTSLLKELANLYLGVAKHAYANLRIPSTQVKDVFQSTFFDSENSAQIVNNQKIPSLSLTACLIINFLESHKKKFTERHEKEFYILLLNCWHTTLMLDLSTFFPNEMQDELKGLITAYLTDLILNLENGERILIPGGWMSIPEKNIEGHFILYVLQRNDSSNFTKVRINTHQFHKIENPSDPISEVFRETISAKAIHNFIPQVLELQFPETLMEKIKRCPLNQKYYSLASVGEKISKESCRLPFGFELQRTSANCFFVSCLVIYQYLYYFSKTSELSDNKNDVLEESKKVTLNFRNRFQEFVNDFRERLSITESL